MEFQTGYLPLYFALVSMNVALWLIINLFKKFWNSKSIRHGNVVSEDISTMGQMAAGIAHEINNPMATIAGGVSVLKLMHKSGKFDTQIFEKQLENMDVNIKRVSKIIQGMKDLSRENNEADFEEYTLKELVEDSLTQVESTLINNGIELRYTSKSPLLKSRINCNKVQMGQVLLNLICNAKDAILDSDKAEDWIELQFEQRDNMLQIRVVDGGKGVPTEVQKKAFEPFYTTKEVGKGTGLGLSICQKIINSFGGRIMIEDAPHTTFLIELPMSDSLSQIKLAD